MRFILAILALIIAGGVAGFAWWQINGDPVPATEKTTDSSTETADTVSGLPASKSGVARDRLAPVDETVRAKISAINEGAADLDDAALTAKVDAAIAEIVAEQGKDSAAEVQVVTDAALMLYAIGKVEFATVYMEKAVNLHRAHFGDLHRATALAIHDLASLKSATGEEADAASAIDLLREAIVIRRKVLPETHLETAGSLAALADKLFGAWQRLPEDQRSDAMLNEAAAAAVDATNIYEANQATDILDYLLSKIMLGQIAFEKGNYEAATKILGEALPAVDNESDIAFIFLLERPYTAYVNSLINLGRQEEADALQDAIRKKVADAAAEQAQE